jgi:hypothetical protein
MCVFLRFHSMFLLAPRVYSDRGFPLSKDWNIVTGHRWLNPSKMLFIYSTEHVSEFASLHNEGLTKIKHRRRRLGISDSFRGVIWDTHKQLNKDLILDSFPTSDSIIDIFSFPRVVISQLTYNKDIDKANIFVILLAHYIVVSNFVVSSFLSRSNPK